MSLNAIPGRTFDLSYVVPPTLELWGTSEDPQDTAPLEGFMSESTTSYLINNWLQYEIAIPSCISRSISARISNYVMESSLLPPSSGSSGGYNPEGYVTSPTFLAFMSYKPFVLIPDIPCNTVQDWIQLATFLPQSSEISKLSSLSTNPQIIPGLNPDIIARIQHINDAYSSVVNLDYFPVRVYNLPYKSNGTQMTASEFLYHIRMNMNSFVNNTYSSFHPYNAYGLNDIGLWESSNPTGTIINIDILGPDNGSVIVSESSPNHWIFTTIFDPKYGTHPVSGNREFGYEHNIDGSYTFYTRAVDRLTEPFHSFMKNVAFGQADALWESFRSNIFTYVNSHRGTSSIADNVAKVEKFRPDWELVEKVVNEELPLSALSSDCP